MTAENIAQAFHETYERLAPDHGYETREASAVGGEAPKQNKELMIAVVGSLLAEGVISEEGWVDGETVLDPPAPTTCRIVRYRGKFGNCAMRAAIVTADVDTLDPRGVERGDVPALDDNQHVHLWVFTPGASGGFPEFNVAPGDEPGQWSWPPRA